jgi:hypothetical protein
VEILDLVQRRVDNFARVLLPLEATEKKEGNNQNPEDTECAIGAEIGKGVDCKDLPE